VTYEYKGYICKGRLYKGEIVVLYKDTKTLVKSFLPSLEGNLIGSASFLEVVDLNL
jgi:hypothetical protein